MNAPNTFVAGVIPISMFGTPLIERALPPDAVIVHENEDGEEPLNVYAYRRGDLMWLQQGPDLIGIPVEGLERVMVALMGAALTPARGRDEETDGQQL